MLADIVKVLSLSEDVKITVAVLSDSEDIAIEEEIKALKNVRFVSLGLKNMKSVEVVGKVRGLLKEHDVAHVHLFPALYLAAIANIGLGTRLIYTEHSTHNRRRNHKIFRPIEKWIYSRYSGIAAISEATRTNLIAWLGKGMSEKISVISNGVDLSRFRDVKRKAAEDIFGRKGRVIIMVSRFTEAKDHKTLISAMAHVAHDDAFLVLVGEGNTQQSCRELVEQLNVAEKVMFLGSRKDVPELLGASTIGTQISNWEGFGLTAIEMMATGVPVVASDVEGLSGIVKDAGLLVAPKDAEGLARSIDKLLDDITLRESLIEKGMIRASQYDIRNTASQYLKMYKRFNKM